MCVFVLALAAQAYLSVGDFCQFLGATLRGVLHMRVLRDDDPSKYMVLLQMASQQAADELRQQHNGKFYSSMAASDPDAPAEERCLVYYVSHLEWHPPATPTDGDLALAAAAADLSGGGTRPGSPGGTPLFEEQLLDDGAPRTYPVQSPDSG